MAIHLFLSVVLPGQTVRPPRCVPLYDNRLPFVSQGFSNFFGRVILDISAQGGYRMRFSTKSRYGLRLMAELACAAPGRAMPLKEISERQQLSLKYLEQLVTPLARAGLVKSERGSQGGYRLDSEIARRPPPARSSRPWRAASPPIPCLESEINECPLSGQCATPALLGRAGRGHQPISGQRDPGRHRQKHGRKRGRTCAQTKNRASGEKTP